MSEFLAEARILVRPDTTKFRALLEAELAAAIRPISVPVVPVMAGGISGVTAETTAFTSAQAAAAAETQTMAAALEAETIAATTTAAAADKATASTVRLTAVQKAAKLEAKELAAAEAARTASLLQGARGAAASGLSLLGLRGATLAASGAFLAGTAAVVGFAKAVQSSAELETELNVFRVTAGATADEMTRVSEASRQLGRDITLPGVTAGSAATAMTELAKAGLSVEDSLAGARGALQLATAAQIDVKDSTNLVAGALNAFNLAGTDAVKVADLLTGAAKESQGEIGDMGTALSQAAAVSHLFGVSIEDTVTLLTQLAKAGIAGGRAGTSLRVAFLRLVNPPADAAKALKALNVQVQDLQTGGLNVNIFTDIQKALQGYTKEQARATLATIFGADAIRAAGIIGAQGEANFEKLRIAVTEAGLAQEQAGARTQGLEGDVLNLQNQVGDLGLTIGDAVKGPLSSLVTAFADTAAAANDAIGFIGDFRKALDQPFEFKIPGGGGATGNSVADQIVKGLFLTGPAFVKQAKETLDATILGIVNDARDTVKREKAIADLATEGGVFGVTALIGPIVEGIKDAASKAVLKASQQKLGLGVKQIENIVGGFDAQQVRAQISGNNAKLLDVLNTEQDFLIRQLDRQFVQRRPALRRALEQNLLGVVNDIESIQKRAQQEADRLKREAEQAAREAEAAVRDREQALLAGFGVARDQQANKIAAAAQTQGLKDDVTRQKQLKALVLQQIAAVRDRISIEGGRKAAIVALQAVLTQVNGSLQSLAKQQQDAQKAQRDALLQGTRLDIDFDQTTENKKKEIADRKKLISQLKVELATVKQGTNAYKEIRNAIAEQNAALKAIQAEKQKGQSFAQASFDFLQAQQGFASSLLGNLIPTGSTAGLVGGGSVQGALTPVAGAADARSQSGVTAGMGNTTNNWLRQIHAQLKELNGETKAPEATWQRRISWSWGDGVGGG